MDIGIISMRYAKALIEYAKEKGAEDVLYGELTRLAHNLAKYPKLKEVLNNPILVADEKLKLIKTAANGTKKSSQELVRFVKLVLKQRREMFLQFMCMSYLELYRQLKHIAVGTLVTAVPVDKEMEERIRQTAAAVVHAEMELETIVDPSIEGGFVFDINGYRVDASVMTRLKRVKQQFIEKNKRIV